MFYNTYVDTLFVKAFDGENVKRVCKVFNYGLIPIVIANFGKVFHKFIHLLYQNENEF